MAQPGLEPRDSGANGQARDHWPPCVWQQLPVAEAACAALPLPEAHRGLQRAPRRQVIHLALGGAAPVQDPPVPPAQPSGVKNSQQWVPPVSLRVSSRRGVFVLV